MLVLQFSCNFDVVVGGGEHCVYLCHDIDLTTSDSFLKVHCK